MAPEPRTEGMMPLGCDGCARFSAMLSADHFLPAADEVHLREGVDKIEVVTRKHSAFALENIRFRR